MSLKRMFAVALVWMLPVPGLAAQWSVDANQSRVDFDYTRNGAPATGVFGSFSGSGAFDVIAPETSELTVQIDSRSIDLNDRMASAFATSAEWFDSSQHRYITYKLTGLKPRPDGRYDAEGMLTLRGQTKPVAAVIALGFDGQTATATGVVSLNREDYLLGVGPSSMFVEIGTEVAVRFELRATQQ
ncbi:MAG: YceI family protein [Pseudomonadota bacterium]